MIELGQILTGLVQRTNEGKLTWSSSAQGDRFVTSVDAISIVIVEVGGFGGPNYRLEIINEAGDTVDSLGYDESTSEQDLEMSRLFVLARRSASDVDVTLEKLAKALEL